MKNQSGIFYLLIFLPLLIAIYLLFSDDLLVPKGYALAIDGFVISRNLVLLFILYVSVKIGFFFLKNNRE